MQPRQVSVFQHDLDKSFPLLDGPVLCNASNIVWCVMRSSQGQLWCLSTCVKTKNLSGFQTRATYSFVIVAVLDSHVHVDYSSHPS